MPRLLPALLLCLSLSSCGSSFHRDWAQAKATPQPDAVAGAWSGTWLSHGNGHSGSLKAIIGAADSKDGSRSVRYRATWAKILSGGFSTTHRIDSKTGGFRGTESLGKFGSFDYEGSVKGTEFKSNYKAAGDHGVFQMQRQSN
jgi:hypothetical protein